MIENRSAPPGSVVPALLYKDVCKAIEWLHGAFGFVERLRTLREPDGTIHHAQLTFGQGSVILSGDAASHPDGFVRAVMVRVANIDAHYERARQFGARILSPPDTKAFGERQYSAEDLEAHRWAFTESVTDVKPESWGAVVSEIEDRLSALPRPRVCYLHIPAVDAHESAAFYERVFGWNIRHRERDRPSFDDATGNVSGAWFTDRKASGEAGLLVSIWVDDIDATLALAVSHGGEVVLAPQPDTPGGNCWIATFRDPAGNCIGLYREGGRTAVLG